MEMGQAGVALAVRVEVVVGRPACRAPWCPCGRRAGSPWCHCLLLLYVAMADGDWMMGHARGRLAVRQVMAVVMMMGQARVALAVRLEVAVRRPARRSS